MSLQRVFYRFNKSSRKLDSATATGKIRRITVSDYSIRRILVMDNNRIVQLMNLNFHENNLSLVIR